MKRTIKRLLLLLTLLLPGAAAFEARAEVPDSITRKMTLLAARDDTRQLRPLFQRYGAQLEPSARLFCHVAFARERHDDARLVACIDSLLEIFLSALPANTRYTLAVVKAGAMMRLERYAELYDFCRREMRRYRRRPQSEPYEELGRLARKARRLTDTLSLRGRVLRMAQADRAIGLRRYADSLSRLDPYARLMARLTLLAAAPAHGSEQAAVADSLLTFYADSLDGVHTDVSRCLDAGMQGLFAQGGWVQLADFCARHAAALPARYAPRLARYGHIAQQFAGSPEAAVHRPARTCILPTTREWPMMARIVINGRAYDDMVIETGYPVTLLTPDQAARCGLQVLSDTLLVNSMFGPLKVRPALARSICLGEVELTDVPVYVATADNPSLAPGFSGLIGTSALARIGVVDIEAERLVFPYRPAAAEPDSTAPLRLSSHGGNLLVGVWCDEAGGTYRRFALDTGQSGSLFSTFSYPRTTTDVSRLALRLGAYEVRVPYAELTDTHAYDHEGALGLSLLKSFERVRLDFGRMRLTPFGTPRPFHYRNVEQWINDGNLFSLSRNLRALAVVSDDVGYAMARIFSLYGQNRPEALVKAIDSLWATDSAARHAPTLAAMRLRALEEQGLWARAAAFIDSLPAIQAGDAGATDVRRTLAERRRLYAQGLSAYAPGAVRFQPLEGGAAADSVCIPLGHDSESPLRGWLTNGRRRAEFEFDPTLTYSRITPRQARRLGAHRLKQTLTDETAAGRTMHVAVIPRLVWQGEGGQVELTNVVCLVDAAPQGAAGLRLGLDVWRRFAAVAVAPGRRLTLYDAQAAVPVVPRRAAAMRLDGGNLYVSAQAESASGAREVVLRLAADSACTLSRAQAAGSSADAGAVRVAGRDWALSGLTAAPPDALSSGSMGWRLLTSGGGVVFHFAQMRLWSRP